MSRSLSTPRNKNKAPSIIGNYIIEKTLGKGTFGNVHLGLHTLTGEKVAIKIIPKKKLKNRSDKERLSREIKILESMTHPYIIQLYEIIKTEKSICLVMEYAEGGEMFDYIVSKKKLDEQLACRLMQQLWIGLDYIHIMKIAHRDLKPENLLLDSNLNLKIADFGLSNLYESWGLLKTACGSPSYAAPEMIKGMAYTPLKTDIWSSGVVMYAMVCGFLPFEDSTTIGLYKKILSGEFEYPSHLSGSARDLLAKILNVNPEQRIDLNEIYQHKWFKMVNQELMTNTANCFPVNEEAVSYMEKYGFDLCQVREDLKMKKHNKLTATYYLVVKKLNLLKPKRKYELRRNMMFKNLDFRHSRIKENVRRIFSKRKARLPREESPPKNPGENRSESNSYVEIEKVRMIGSFRKMNHNSKDSSVNKSVRLSFRLDERRKL